MHYSKSEHHSNHQVSVKGLVMFIVASVLLIALFEYAHEYAVIFGCVLAGGLAFAFRLNHIEDEQLHNVVPMKSSYSSVDGGTLSKADMDKPVTASRNVVSDGGSFERGKGVHTRDKLS